MPHSYAFNRAAANRFIAMSVYCIVMALHYHLEAEKKRQNPTYILSPLRVDVSFSKITSVYTREGFKRAFRMYRENFYKLLRYVSKGLQRNEEMGKRSKRTVIPPDMRLGITLRLLAGASYLDLQTSYRVGASTVYKVFHSTCHVLVKALVLPGLPSTVENLRKSSLDFKLSRRPPSPLTGCVGALDGIAVKIKMPKKEEQPAAYFCRKGYYSLPVQALCDSTYKFTSYSAKCVGSTHDALVHAVSSLGWFLEQGRLEKEFWICGDDAYHCTESLITPYPNSQANDEQKHFNYFLSVLRVHIEQAFGMLVARWRIIRDGLEFDLGTNSRIICLCMKLHNYCIDNGEKSFVQGLSSLDRERIQVETEHWYNEAKEDCRDYVSATATNRSGVLSEKRDLLCENVWVSQRKRPILHGVPIEQPGVSLN